MEANGGKQGVPIFREGVTRKGREVGIGCLLESANQRHRSFVEVVKGKLLMNHEKLINKSEVNNSEVEDSSKFLNLLPDEEVSDPQYKSKVDLGSEGLFCREEKELAIAKYKGQLISKKTNIKQMKANGRGVNSLVEKTVFNGSTHIKGLVFGLSRKAILKELFRLGRQV
ncbi:hypothetical protein LWI28_022195 [Acer negundo]|uniref:Uncharacterized protein n=1 Tax=Acer negundo TaxID=4023 RepID=A0AAD5P3W0_ACENE|nr:hypothetical protein LWI28_022195 [Acer negundo]